MPIPSRQIGWSTQDNLLWQIAKQMEQTGCQLCELNDNIQTITGTAGTSGTSGVNGSSGSSGTSGLDSSSGTSGVNGTSGVDGTSGVNGSSGSSGVSGTSGSSGTSYNPPFAPVYGLFSQTANSAIVTNTTVETTIIDGGVGTLTVGANQFSIGDSFRADLGGVMNADNNQTLRVRIKAGSVILADSGAQNLGSSIGGDVWSLSINFTIRALGAAGVASVVTLGTFNYVKTNNGTVEGFSWNTVNNTTFDTTISNTLDITVQWGSATTANNIYSDIFVLNKIY